MKSNQCYVHVLSIIRTWLHISWSICSNGHCSSRSQYPLSQQQHHKSNKNVTECPKGSYNWSKQFQATRERIWTMAIRAPTIMARNLVPWYSLESKFVHPFTWKTNFVDCSLFSELYISPSCTHLQGVFKNSPFARVLVDESRRQTLFNVSTLIIVVFTE